MPVIMQAKLLESKQFYKNVGTGCFVDNIFNWTALRWTEDFNKRKISLVSNRLVLSNVDVYQVFVPIRLVSPNGITNYVLYFLVSYLQVIICLCDTPEKEDSLLRRRSDIPLKNLRMNIESWRQRVISSILCFLDSWFLNGLAVDKARIFGIFGLELVIFESHSTTAVMPLFPIYRLVNAVILSIL